MIAREYEVIPLTRRRVHLRKAGDVLRPAHEPYEALMQVKATQGSHYFEAQYQQNPVPAGGNLMALSNQVHRLVSRAD